MDSIIPRARIRRWANTVNPPMDTRAMRSMPRVANASTMVSGPSTLLLTAPDIVTLSAREPVNALGGALKRALTWVGLVTCPGGTRANSSSRLWGF